MWKMDIKSRTFPRIILRSPTADEELSKSVSVFKFESEVAERNSQQDAAVDGSLPGTNHVNSTGSAEEIGTADFRFIFWWDLSA